MSVFVDTALIMYAGGAPHRLREPSRRLLSAAVEGRLDAVTSVEVIQEIHHRFTAIDDRARGVAMAESSLDLFAPVLPITDAVMRRMTEMIAEHPSLSARDLVHAATCLESRIDVIVSPDRGFDGIDGLARVDPADVDLLI